VVRGVFHRIDARLAPSGAPRTLIKIARFVPHPCAQRESDSLPRPGSGRRATLVIGRAVRLSASAVAATRCFSPTSATNVRSIHPRSVRSPSVGLSPPPTDPARGSPAFRRATLTARPALQLRYLAVAVLKPQVDARLTTPIELRVCCPRSPPFGEAEYRSGRCSRTAAFSTACTVELQTPLSPSVDPFAAPASRRSSRYRELPSPPPRQRRAATFCTLRTGFNRVLSGALRNRHGTPNAAPC